MFSRTVDLAYELTLIDEQFKSALRALAELRNKYSHRLSYAVKKSDILAVCEAMPKWASLLGGGIMEKHLGFDLRPQDSRVALAVLAMMRHLLAMKELLDLDFLAQTEKARLRIAVREKDPEKRVTTILETFKLYGEKLLLGEEAEER